MLHDGREVAMSAAGPRVLRSLTIEQPEHVQPIWSSWDEMAVLTSRPYCSPAWMMSWWEHVAPPGALLRVIAVHHGAELAGIAPFFVDRSFGGVRRYRLLGAGTCAPVDILARPGMEREVGALIASGLAEANPSVDVIMLEGVPGDSPWPGLLCDVWPRPRALRVVRQFSQPSPIIELHGSTYEDWLASKSSHARKKLRHEIKTMRNHGATIRLSNAEELSRDLASFTDLHRARWRKRGGSGVLDARVERMLATVGTRLLDQGRFRLWSMELGGRTISSHLFIVAGGEAAYWLGGFDERETGVRRPGVMTILWALEHAFSIGDRRLDLGPGGQPYKLELSRTASSVEWVLLIPPGRRSLVARGQLARLRARIVLAQRLSPRAKRLLRRVREWRPSWGGR